MKIQIKKDGVTITIGEEVTRFVPACKECANTQDKDWKGCEHLERKERERQIISFVERLASRTNEFNNRTN